LTLYAVAQTGIFSDEVTRGTADSPTGSDKPQTAQTHGSITPLLILTACAPLAIHISSGSTAVLAIGLSYALLTAIALRLLERAKHEAENPTLNGSVIYSANGFLAQPDEPAKSAQHPVLAIVRDVSAAAALSTAIATLNLESFSFGGLTYDSVGYHGMFGQALWDAMNGFGMVLLHITMLASLLFMVSSNPGMVVVDTLHASSVTAISVMRLLILSGGCCAMAPHSTRCCRSIADTDRYRHRHRALLPQASCRCSRRFARS